MSDVPLGMFLSGGVDSSAIAAMTKRLTADPSKTFSVGYGEEQYSELELCGARWQTPSAPIITKCVVGHGRFFQRSAAADLA